MVGIGLPASFFISIPSAVTLKVALLISVFMAPSSVTETALSVPSGPLPIRKAPADMLAQLLHTQSSQSQAQAKKNPSRKRGRAVVKSDQDFVRSKVGASEGRKLIEIDWASSGLTFKLAEVRTILLSIERLSESLRVPPENT